MIGSMRWAFRLFVVTACSACLLGCAKAPTGGSAANVSAEEGQRLEADVLVLGSEPEAIAAAVAAAEEGAKTILVTKHQRMGGLLVVSEMNSLDVGPGPMRPKGLFGKWWRMVGGGSAYDIRVAEQAFDRMLETAGVQVIRGAKELSPLVEAKQVVGAKVGGTLIRAKQIVDGTSEADFAAAAGAPFTLGWNSMGYDARMADTLVFRIDHVNWDAMRRHIAQKGASYAKADGRAAWGFFGRKWITDYKSKEPGIRLRGLNLGRQNDGTVLVNALLIHGIDPFDPASVREGRERAKREAERIVATIRKDIPGYERATLGSVAEELYVRETRHLQAMHIVTFDEALDNLVTDQAVAAGNYPMDVQVLTPNDTGFVYGAPKYYGIPLGATVPKSGPALWVVGKCAGYDPIVHSSARVVPTGMVVAEAVGVAAARCAKSGQAPQAAVNDKRFVADLRTRLKARGAAIPPVGKSRLGPASHPAFDAYRVMMSRGLATGGYGNDPNLNETISSQSFGYILANVLTRFHANPQGAKAAAGSLAGDTSKLTTDKACKGMAAAAKAMGLSVGSDWASLSAAGLTPKGSPPSGNWTRGDAYRMAAALSAVKD